MKIGFDIDDTLNDVRYIGIDVFNEVLKKSLSYSSVDSIPEVTFQKAFGITDEQRKKIWKEHAQRIYNGARPLPGAVYSLNQIKDLGHEIFFITARSDNKETKQGTIKWLQDNGFPYNEKRFFIGMKDQEKIDIIKDQKIELYFDDKPTVIESLLQSNFYDFIIKDQCYNKQFHQKRIKKWSFNLLIGLL